MENIKQRNIKNRTYYKNIDIYYIGYITIKKIDDYENIYSGNPLYLVVNTADGHIEEKNGNKYLIFASADKNNKVLKNTQNFGMRLNTWLKL